MARPFTHRPWERATEPTIPPGTGPPLVRIMGPMPARYTIQELSTVTGISVRSLRNYLRQYGEFMDPDRGACNALLFGEDDVEAFVKIRTYLREGRTRDEIKAILAGEVEDAEVEIRREEPAEAPAGPPALRGPEVPGADVSALVRNLELQNQLLESIAHENRALRERLDVLEVRLRLREGDPGGPALLPAATAPRRIPVRARRVEIPLPYFMLRLKDGATAAVRAVITTMLSRAGYGPRPASPRAR